MEVGPLFSGSALATVDPTGRFRLPPFLLDTLVRRSDGRRIVFAAHDQDPCLTANDPGARSLLFGRDGSRRLFGFAEETEFDRRGTVAIPAMMRWKGRIEGLALLIGTGSAFEIWNPDLALEADDPDLREIAGYRLDQFNGREKEEAR